ncbi:MAG: O-antigen ligase family protein, partial [Clostridia bacterium]|nr:O-antigen ligase family protein [Clostridia bacterium]
MEYTEIINMPLKSENKFLDKVDYISIFILIYSSSSFYMLTKPGMLCMLLNLTCVFMLYIISLLCGKKIIINSNMAVKVITLCAIIGIGAFSARGEDPKQSIINLSNIFIAYLFALNYDFKDFAKKFEKVVYFLCVYSIIVYFISTILPDFIKLFPQTENVNGFKVHNLIFAVVYPNSTPRNSGMFWEPGAFQTYINLALIIELFYFKQLRKNRLIVYLITIFTTYSTVGYITTLFIAYTYITQLLFSSANRDKNSTRNLFFILTIVVIAVVVFLSLNTSTSERVFGKLKYIEGTTGGRNTSASVRMGAFTKPFKVFWDYPLFGAGTRGMTNFALNERYNMNTCTFVNWFAYFGVFYGALMMRMFYKFAKRFSNKKLIVYMIFFAMFLTTATENYYRNSS